MLPGTCSSFGASLFVAPNRSRNLIGGAVTVSVDSKLARITGEGARGSHDLMWRTGLGTKGELPNFSKAWRVIRLVAPERSPS